MRNQAQALRSNVYFFRSPLIFDRIGFFGGPTFIYNFKLLFDIHSFMKAIECLLKVRKFQRETVVSCLKFSFFFNFAPPVRKLDIPYYQNPSTEIRKKLFFFWKFKTSQLPCEISWTLKEFHFPYRLSLPEKPRYEPWHWGL